MKECDIFREGVKTYYDPSYIFLRGQYPLTAMIYAPAPSASPPFYRAYTPATVADKVGGLASIV